MQSVFSNIHDHKLNSQQYLCDVFRGIENTAEDTFISSSPINGNHKLPLYEGEYMNNLLNNYENKYLGVATGLK